MYDQVVTHLRVAAPAWRPTSFVRKIETVASGGRKQRGPKPAEDEAIDWALAPWAQIRHYGTRGLPLSEHGILRNMRDDTQLHRCCIVEIGPLLLSDEDSDRPLSVQRCRDLGIPFRIRPQSSHLEAPRSLDPRRLAHGSPCGVVDRGPGGRDIV